ncbi:hypothetical protein AWM68_02675 [Fictibacillus phosphorivorans]|uniref:Uncharacterized protein n=1 Tax=Fictibacillus phosphorivorans TaxID=1221500 RepID=A0A165P6V9_9BACL|nr:hypothetical protein [Fictibacillus phosphorivorans]KZE69190.1 hypothetical protein AWM68_02675 [Fictibacillus phosphorivorans]
MFQNTRLSAQEVNNIYQTNPYGITNITGYGQAIVKITSVNLDLQQNTGSVVLTIYTPTEDIQAGTAIKYLTGWTPYTGPIPPQFGHQGGLPGGMGGQGYGQGQTFPSPWGGQGTPGGWGTWGY